MTRTTSTAVSAATAAGAAFTMTATPHSFAEMIGASKVDTGVAALGELQATGAVEIETVQARAGRRTVCTVHELPPPSGGASPVAVPRVVSGAVPGAVSVSAAEVLGGVR